MDCAESWCYLGEDGRAQDALRNAMLHSLRPHDRKDSQVERLITWAGRANSVDPEHSRRRIALCARACEAMERVNGVEAESAAVELLSFSWETAPAIATCVRRWMTERCVLSFRGAVERLLECAVRSTPECAPEALLAAGGLLAWDASGNPIDTLEQIGRAVASCSERTLSAVLTHARHVIDTQVSPGARSAWCSAIARGLLAGGVDGEPFGFCDEPVDTEDVERREPKIVLGDNRELAGEQLAEALSPFENLMQTMRDARWRGHPASDVDLAPYFEHLESGQLSRLAEVLPPVDTPQNVLHLAQAMRSSGDSPGAARIAEDLFRVLEVHHWFSYYGGRFKQKALALWAQNDLDGARAAARRLFAQELQGELYWYQSCATELHEILEPLFGEVDARDIWPLVEDYLLAVFPEITDDSAPSPAVDNAEEETTEAAIGALLHDYCVHSASVLSAYVSSSALHGVVKGHSSSLHAIDCLLQGSDNNKELALAILAAAHTKDPNSVTRCRSTVEAMGLSAQLNNRLAADALCHRCGWSAARVPVNHNSLPPMYRLEVPLEAEIFDPGDYLLPAGQTLRDSTNPRQLLSIVATELRALADMSNISLGTIYRRASTLMEEIAPRHEWDSTGESRVMNENKAAGISLAYRRPRSQVAWCAANRTAAELVDAGRIGDQHRPLLDKLFRRYDPDQYLFVPQGRLQSIRPLVSGENLRVEGWLEAADPTHALGPRLPDDRSFPGQTLRDSTNPRQLLSIVATELRALADMSNISLGTIYRRASTLMEEIAPRHEWDSTGESRVMNENKAAGISLAYRRPRSQVAWCAANRTAAELVDAGRIGDQHRPLLDKLFRRYDPDQYLFVPQGRLQSIRPLVSGENLRVEGWLEAADPTHALGPRLPDDRWVIAEATSLAWLARGEESEIRESGLWVDGSEPDRDGHRFRAERWLTVREYRNGQVRAAGDSLAVMAWGYEPEATEGWLGLNPVVAARLDWRLSDEGLFQWIDSAGDIVVETIYWVSGVEQYDRGYPRDEVGHGWLVVASDEAIRALTSELGQLNRWTRITRTLRGTEGHDGVYSVDEHQPLAGLE